MVDIHGGGLMPLDERRAEVLSILREHGNVRLVLSGHMHLSSISVLDGGAHCMTGAMSSWPLDMGVIDPAKVTRLALQNAASIASLVLTTDCMVAQAPKKSGEERPGFGPGLY